jgi:GNAT superfamily N-acetyltransferase
MALRPFDDACDRPLLRAWVDGPDTARWLTGHSGALEDADLDAWRDATDTTRWVHEHDGVPVAYGELQEHPAVPYMRLARLLVDPARRTRGLGRQLARALMAEARTRRPGWPIYTRVPPDDLPAILAYPAVGFVPLEPLPPDADEAYLWLRLLEADPAEPGGSLDE